MIRGRPINPLRRNFRADAYALSKAGVVESAERALDLPFESFLLWQLEAAREAKELKKRLKST